MLLTLYGGPVVSLGYAVIAWILNLIISVTCLFISLFLFITHDDMRHLMIEPGELA